MTEQLQALIAAAHSLSAREKLELLQIISRDLQQTYSWTEDSAAFWKPRTIDELVAAQLPPIVTDVAALTADFWPEDESADEFNRFIAERRHADRLESA
jgi:hypothetical protein